MPWYKKQLQELLKKQEKESKNEKKDTTDASHPSQVSSYSGKNRRKNPFGSMSPVAQRNRNRDKTDLY